MSKPGLILAARILTDLKELALLAERAKQGWEKAKSRNDDFYFDAVALNLHGFYSGLENIFEKIASAVDGTVPSAANWHKELLNQMCMEVPNIRPAVISGNLCEMLEEYRGFRHVVRNVYTHHLNPEKMEPLVIKIDEALAELTTELTAFAKFVQEAE